MSNDMNVILKKRVLLIFISLILLSGCSNFPIPTNSLVEQLKESQRTSKNTNFQEISISAYPSNNLRQIKCKDKDGNNILLVPDKNTEFVITKKSDGDKITVYFDTMILQNDTLFGLRSRFLGGLRAIPLADVSYIEVYAEFPKTTKYFMKDPRIVYQNKEFKVSGTLYDFVYIDKKMDLTGLTKIATLEAFCINIGSETIRDLFEIFRKSANNLGSNSCQIDSFSYKSHDSLFVYVSLYYLSKAEIEKAHDLFPKNKIYVFGELDITEKGGKTIKLNGKSINLLPLEYACYQNKTGEEATVSVGGLAGSELRLVGREGRMPEHLSLSGFSMAPGTGRAGQVGFSFSTGSIKSVAIDFGQFLVALLKEKK